MIGLRHSYDVAIMTRLGVNPNIKMANVDKVADQREDELVESETFFMIFADEAVRFGDEEQTDTEFLSGNHKYGLSLRYPTEMHHSQEIWLGVVGSELYRLNRRTLKFEWDNSSLVQLLKRSGWDAIPERQSYEVPCEKVSEDMYVSRLNDLRNELAFKAEAGRQNDEARRQNEIDAMRGSQI
jgi:hypothetical protein